MEQSLKERIVVFFRKRPTQWIASGDLQRIVAAKTSYTPQNVGRRLRELTNAKLLDVEYRQKNHAWYRWHQDPIQEPLFPTQVKETYEKKSPQKSTKSYRTKYG